MSDVQMSEDDLYSTDSRALKELKDLYQHFCEASDAYFENASNLPGRRNRAQRSSLMALSQAYGWAAGNVADALKQLGHDVPRVPCR